MKLQSRCVRIELKPESIARVREWASTLNSRRAEVLSTLRDEGVYLETAYLDQEGEKAYLVYIMRAQDFEHARAAAERSTHKIDEYHKAVMRDICGAGRELELLIDFDRTHGEEGN